MSRQAADQGLRVRSNARPPRRRRSQLSVRWPAALVMCSQSAGSTPTDLCRVPETAAFSECPVRVSRDRIFRDSHLASVTGSRSASKGAPTSPVPPIVLVLTRVAIVRLHQISDSPISCLNGYPVHHLMRICGIITMHRQRTLSDHATRSRINIRSNVKHDTHIILYKS